MKKYIKIKSKLTSLCCLRAFFLSLRCSGVSFLGLIDNVEIADAKEPGPVRGLQLSSCAKALAVSF